MSKGRKKKPKDYIRLACDLHLDFSVDDIEDENSNQAISKFLEGETRLFVWIDEEECPVASTENLSTNHFGAIAFVHSTGESLQCMTLAPRTYPNEEKKEDKEESDALENDEKKSTTGTLDALQTYTRHCFGPAVHALTSSGDEEDKAINLFQGLEDKIRELDVALGQGK